MNKDDFAALLDKSWEGFRQQLLDLYPPVSNMPSQRFDFYATELSYAPSNPASPASVVKDAASVISLPTSLQSLGTGQMASVKSGRSYDAENSDTLNRYHGDSAAVLGSGLNNLNSAEAAKVKNRLRLRLGATSTSKLVSGRSLLDAVVSLGLTTYQEEDMNEFVNHLADFVGLFFESAVDKPKRPSRSLDSLSMFRAAEDASNLGRPKWSWPSPEAQSQGTHLHRSVTKGMTFAADGHATRTYNVVPAQALMDVFLSQEADVHKRIFGPRLMNQFRAMREILLAGDTNRLVAELTFVRINDLAAPPEPVHPLMYIEPLVAVLIVLNGIMIGFQTDPAYEDWSGWAYVDLTFQCCLLVEILFRMHLLRCRSYWWGPESYWNWFDLFLFASGLADVVLQFTGDKQSDMAATSLLRFCRLIRLVRIVKAIGQHVEL